MTYAIIEAGGAQLKVEPGRFYDINRLDASEDDTITLSDVLLVAHDGTVSIGAPRVDGATVEVTVMEHRRGRKIIVYKMKPKKKTRKKRGHRQELTRIMVDSISLGGKTIAVSEATTLASEDAADEDE